MKLQVKPGAQPLGPGVVELQRVDAANAPVADVGLQVLQLTAGSAHHYRLAEAESAVIALAGRITVQVGATTYADLGTRQDVFEKKPTDTVYVPVDTPVQLSATTAATVAIASSPTHTVMPARLLPASIEQVEYRGKYNNRRLVHNILPDTVPFAAKLLLVEVYTDSANWSSYPPHRHEVDHLPQESQLEELYYHLLRPQNGFVFQRVYTDDRTLDETMAVADGDVVVVPRGYHPVGVPDGIDSYYLNVMAGPKRVWRFHDDPALAWVKDRP